MPRLDPGSTTLNELIQELNEKGAHSIVLRTSNAILIVGAGPALPVLEAAATKLSKMSERVDFERTGEEERN